MQQTTLVRALRGFRAIVSGSKSVRDVVVGELVELPTLLAVQLFASNKAEPAPVLEEVPAADPPAELEGEPAAEASNTAEDPGEPEPNESKPRRGRPPKA